MKKIICIACACLILITSVLSVPVDVHASSSSAAIDAYFNEIINRISNDNGFIFSNSKAEQMRQALNIDENMKRAYDTIVNPAVEAGTLSIDIKTGNIKIAESTYKQLTNWFTNCMDEYLSQEDNQPVITWMPVVKSSDMPVDYFYSTTLYQQARSYIDSHTVSAISVRANTASSVYVGDASNLVLINYGDSNWTEKLVILEMWTNNFGTSVTNSILGNMYFSSRDGVSLRYSGLTYDGYYQANGSGFVSNSNFTLAKDNSYGENLLNVCYPWSGIPFMSYYQRYCYLVVSDEAGFSYIPIFKTLDDYKKWVVGQSDYYRVTPTYTGGDVSINPNADYSTVYNNITQTIQNNYNDGKDYSDILAAIQVAYAESMKKISESLGDIEDNTEQSNTWLEKIYNQVTDIDEVIKSQFDSMIETITNGFNSVIDALSVISLPADDDSGGTSGDDSGTEHKSFWTRLGEFCSSLINGILSLIETVLMKAIDGLLYLVNIVIDNAQIAFDAVTERMEIYVDMFRGNTFFGSLRNALPEDMTDIFVIFSFGLVAYGVIVAVKGR